MHVNAEFADQVSDHDPQVVLFIGERVGLGARTDVTGIKLPKVDIAVDPLEGTNLCATGAPNAIAVLAASDEGGLLHAPDLYMEKLIVGADSQGRGQPGCARRGQPRRDRPLPRSPRR